MALVPAICILYCQVVTLKSFLDAKKSKKKPVKLQKAAGRSVTASTEEPSTSSAAPSLEQSTVIPDSYCLPTILGDSNITRKLKNPKAIFLLPEVSEILRLIANSIRVVSSKPEPDSIKKVIRKLVRKYPHLKLIQKQTKEEQVVINLFFLKFYTENIK